MLFSWISCIQFFFVFLVVYVFLDVLDYLYFLRVLHFLDFLYIPKPVEVAKLFVAASGLRDLRLHWAATNKSRTSKKSQNPGHLIIKAIQKFQKTKNI